MEQDISSAKNIRIGDYTYELPQDRIAKYPLRKRDDAKLLCYLDGHIIEGHFTDIVDYLPKDSVMVVNTTKVIRARLEFFRSTGARIEVFCLEPHEPALYEQSLATKGEVVWHCLVGQSKKWKEDFLVRPLNEGGVLRVSRLDTPLPNGALIKFEWDSNQTFGELLESLGELPIPPYLNRRTEESDLKDYQTIYATQEGSVAAPTAGLHFTRELLDRIACKGIREIPVTLHVGAGTFLPVKSETMGGHTMHTEFIEVHKDSIQMLYEGIQNHHPIVSIGTTSTRTLESLYYMGIRLISGEKDPFIVPQWMPYSLTEDVGIKEAFTAILDWLKSEHKDTIVGETQLMIAPGFTYRIVDYLVTNFHQPNSTLLLLVAAFVGDDWHKIYDYALSHDFRFLSYGDGSLLKKR